MLMPADRRGRMMASPFSDRVEIECCRTAGFRGASEAAEALETAEGLKAAGVFDDSGAILRSL